MNDSSLKNLLIAARHAGAPRPPADFAQRVLTAVRREPTRVTVWEGLEVLFPRLALGSAVLIVLLSGWEYRAAEGGLTELVTQAALAQPGWLLGALPL